MDANWLLAAIVAADPAATPTVPGLELFTEAGRGLIAQGLLGFLLVLALGMGAYLYRGREKDNRENQAKLEALIEKVVTALERSSTAQNTIAVAVPGRMQALEELARTLVEQGRTTDTEFERHRERLDALLRLLEGISRAGTGSTGR